MKVSATFFPAKWDEKMIDQPSPGTKLTKVSAEFAYTGQMQGQGLAEYVMFYASYDEHDPHEASAEYVGFVRFKGNLNGRSGAFVFEEKGSFQARTATSSLRIIHGSGTDGLVGIRGSGKSVASPAHCSFELDCELP